MGENPLYGLSILLKLKYKMGLFGNLISNLNEMCLETWINRATLVIFKNNPLQSNFKHTMAHLKILIRKPTF